MNGYCNQCDNHCALNDLHCGRGYRAIENGEGARGAALHEGDGGHFRTLPAYPGEGHYRTMPAHPGEDHFRTLPAYPGEGHFRTLPGGPEGRSDGRARGERGFDEHGHGGHHGDRDDFAGFGGREGHPGGRGEHDGHRGPGGMPPRGGMPPFHGRPPRPAPDREMLLRRIDEASLAELIELSGRLMHHRPGAGSHRGQALILAILAGRESLSQRELQQMLGVQPGSMSEIVSKLEKKGLLIREKGEDRRGNLLRITEAGRAAMPKAGAEPDDELFSALDDAQQALLSELLRALLTDWASRLEDAPTRPPMPEGRFVTLEERAPGQDKRVEI